MKTSLKLFAFALGLQLAIVATAQAAEETRVLLQRFPVKPDLSSCRSHLAPAILSPGAPTGLADLLTLPSEASLGGTVQDTLSSAGLVPIAERALAAQVGDRRVYLLPATAEKAGPVHLLLAASKDGKADAFMITFSEDAITHSRTMALSTLDGSERFILDLASGAAYHESKS